MHIVLRPIVPLITCLSITHCATATDSTLLGLSIGGVIGGGFGAAAGDGQGKPREGAAIGALIGAAIGGLAGYLQHKQNEQDKMKLSVGGGKSLPPAMTQPQVERVWVPARVENNTYVEGHYQFIIAQPSRWSRGDEESEGRAVGRHK